MLIFPSKGLNGTISVPGDKSISHRALMLASLASGEVTIENLGLGLDVLATASVLKNLGVEIEIGHGQTTVFGNGFKAPIVPLDCQNSGTTMRLMMGLLSGQHFSSTLVGDASLSKRPMERVRAPLSKMGAAINLEAGGFAPVEISGSLLTGCNHTLQIPSAQVKSALLLSSLFALGEMTLSGKIKSRDHTERMLAYLGVKLSVNEEAISIVCGQKIAAKPLFVPGDPSSAAFFVAAALIVPDSRITIENVLLNPTRIEFFNVLKKMGGRLEIKELSGASFEPYGTITAESSSLVGIDLDESAIPYLIDELPLLAAVAMHAEGVTTVRGAEELRVKESDRLAALEKMVLAMGGTCQIVPDGFSITGKKIIKGGVVETFGDHRIAMSAAIAALKGQKASTILNSATASVSYPEFFQTLEALS